MQSSQQLPRHISEARAYRHHLTAARLNEKQLDEFRIAFSRYESNANWTDDEVREMAETLIAAVVLTGQLARERAGGRCEEGQPN